jgi:zinc protease
MAGYKVPSGPHPDAAALSILASVLSNSPSGILYKRLVETKKATSVGANSMALHDPGYFYFSSVVDKAGDLADVRNTLLEIVENAGNELPSKEEVERAKTQRLKFIEMTLNDPNRVGLGLSEFIAQGDWRMFFIQRDRLKA